MLHLYDYRNTYSLLLVKSIAFQGGFLWKYERDAQTFKTKDR